MIDAKVFSKHQIRAAAAFVGLEIAWPEHYVHDDTNRQPEYLAKFPHGKIPAFEGADGFRIFETSAIARYSKCRSRTVRLIAISINMATVEP